MGNRCKYKKGSILVEQGKVFKIYKITKRKSNGVDENIIHYKPVFKENREGGVDCSIPESSINAPDIRELHTGKEINLLINQLSQKTKVEGMLDIVEAKSQLNLNDMYISAGILKSYFYEDKKNDIPKSKKDILNLALDRIAQEVAYVKHIKLETARQKLIFALEKSV